MRIRSGVYSPTQFEAACPIAASFVQDWAASKIGRSLQERDRLVVGGDSSHMTVGIVGCACSPMVMRPRPD